MRALTSAPDFVNRQQKVNSLSLKPLSCSSTLALPSVLCWTCLFILEPWGQGQEQTGDPRLLSSHKSFPRNSGSSGAWCAEGSLASVSWRCLNRSRQWPAVSLWPHSGTRLPLLCRLSMWWLVGLGVHLSHSTVSLNRSPNPSEDK